MRPRILSSILIIACSGCGGVFSVQPFSDDSNSALDERLYGQWVGENDPRCTLTIRHKPGTKATLEFVDECPADEAGGRRVERAVAFALPDKYDLLSLEIKADGGPVPVVYGIGRYHFPEAETLEIVPLKLETFGRAVERGFLRGEVSYANEPEPAQRAGEQAVEDIARPQPVSAGKPVQNVILSSPASEVLDFIRREGDKSFESEAVVLRRVGPPAAQDNAGAAIGPYHLVVVLTLAAVVGAAILAAIVIGKRRHPELSR